MGPGLSQDNPTVVSAFHTALAHQALVVLGIALVVFLLWDVLSWRALALTRRQRRASPGPQSLDGGAVAAVGALPVSGPAPGYGALAAAGPEAPARRLVRVSFGTLWLFDGFLQCQASMPLGMASQVIRPAASVSPDWVQRLDNFAATVWSYHPVAVPAATVWAQVGLGLWLLMAKNGTLSRLAGLASLTWGLAVWVFGEAFGQIFAPGLSWLFGAPGAVVFYCVAGLLVALPQRAWSMPRTGRVVVRAIGAFFVLMAVLQAWPGRGFWQGQARPGVVAGTLAGMVKQMAQTPQPHFLASWVAAFGRFDAAHGWGVNLFVVIALAAVGGALASCQPTLVRAAVLAAVVLCLADWVLVQDVGFVGGVGTDPNSMLPIAILVIAGYLSLGRAVRPDGRGVDGREVDGREARWTARWRLIGTDPVYAFRTLAAFGAVSVGLLGVVPMTVAAAQSHADAILAQAVDGTPDITDSPSPTFDLVDQYSHAVSLSSLRGKAVALTFLDPVCTSDCPVIAQEFRAADAMLGAGRSRVEMVAIDANPRYTSPAYLVAFDHQERLGGVKNWLYLTGSLPQLEHIWAAFGVQVQSVGGGSMIAHSDVAYVIDGHSRLRDVLDADPGPGTAATQSSFSATLAGILQKALRTGPSGGRP